MVRAPALPVKALLAGVALLLLVVTHTRWLTALGRALVQSETPAHADLAVVLAGDFWGHRILTASELIRSGYVPQALVSGPAGMYGRYECDAAVSFAVEQGYPEWWYIKFPNGANSTLEEARLIVPALRRRQVHKYLLVTSNYHSARAARIFRRTGPDLEMRVVAAPDEYFQPETWWHSRQARKVFALEWCKTVAGAAGL